MANTDPSNWMSQNLATLGPLPLTQLVMPASHDSGMYQVSNCVPTVGDLGANACNTRTQTHSILQQLQNGSRYFDIRPVLYTHNGDNEPTLYTGHYSPNPVMPAGCNGLTLTDFFSQVAQFMESSGDLVILKFSHYYDRDNNSTGFDLAKMENLISLVQSSLSHVMFKQNLGEDGMLITRTLSSYIANGGCVVTVFDNLSNQSRNQSAGIYSYGDKPKSADMMVFDQYADTNDLSEMINNQKVKLTNTGNHDDCLFLLSWTLTQDAGQAADCGINPGGATSILDLANQADGQLMSTVQSWFQDGTIGPSTIPNLLYVDANDTFSLDAAMWLNQQLNLNSST